MSTEGGLKLVAREYFTNKKTQANKRVGDIKASATPTRAHTRNSGRS